MAPDQIVSKMLEHDAFSRWLGIEVHSVSAGSCRLSLTVSKVMLNGFGIAHGGISYSLADSALAFASNAKGRQSLSIDTSISHVHSLREGDVIVAEATCETETDKLGHYTVKLFCPDKPDKKVALFKGIVYKTARNWE